MEIIKKGIHYIATGSNNHSTEIKFCHKDENGNFVDGITNEEFVNILINRLQHLTDLKDSVENIECLLFARQLKSHLLERYKNKQKKKYDNSRDGVSLQTTG
jgi:gamma-glutamyl-gamma-aminobutyrate hydrolase PuuD